MLSLIPLPNPPRPPCAPSCSSPPPGTPPIFVCTTPKPLTPAPSTAYATQFSVICYKCYKLKNPPPTLQPLQVSRLQVFTFHFYLSSRHLHQQQPRQLRPLHQTI